MKNFISVSTNAARFQDLSLNPQKLAGMCAKLKCCMNYEVDSYIEAGKKLPSKEVILQTQDNDYYLFKSDILAGMITYSTDKRLAANLETITAERAKEIIEMNRRGEKPISLLEDDKKAQANNRVVDLLEGGDISRFDKAKKKKKKGNKQQQNAASPESSVLSEKQGQDEKQEKQMQPANNADGNEQHGNRHHHRNNRNKKHNHRHPKNEQTQGTNE